MTKKLERIGQKNIRRIHEFNRYHASSLGRLSPFYFIDPPPPAATTPAPDNQFWWSHTNWSSPAPPGMVTTDTNVGVRLSGRTVHNADKRVIHTWILEAFFWLQRQRLIPSYWGTWHSMPAISSYGFASGWTSYPFVGSPDDKWSKMRLRYGHQVVQRNGQQVMVLGENYAHHTIFDLENGETSAESLPQPQGRRNIPPVVFRLFDDNKDVHARVEIVLEFELEGSSLIELGYSDKRASSNPTFDTFQWTPFPYDPINGQVVAP